MLTDGRRKAEVLGYPQNQPLNIFALMSAPALHKAYCGLRIGYCGSLVIHTSIRCEMINLSASSLQASKKAGVELG